MLLLTDAVGQWWNKNQAPVYGFSLRVSEAAVRACCNQATDLFSRGVFPDNPGPFKRMATYLVLGRLTPFFTFRSGFNDTNGRWIEGCCPTDEQEHVAWITRMLVLSIPFTFAKLYVHIQGRDIPLGQWNGFPSSHYRLEFMGWLRWLDGYSQLKPHLPSLSWGKFNDDRLARMIMSTSLMLESCYYLGKMRERGKCALLDECYCGAPTLDEDLRLDLYYDTKGQASSVPEIE